MGSVPDAPGPAGCRHSHLECKENTTRADRGVHYTSRFVNYKNIGRTRKKDCGKDNPR